ncbi:hypothetical protein [Dictyobacter kobayashii]|uniref:Uncharacterized protein n=1 Tax=Dictyobacter kobayashii TaxID=2014872 RepID=A0A402APV6_9CHLR|nr:hypothetical protein [Dictyobacter kobayashii]GCE21211.1 hypothetical protein KDK_50110 [Dictyobacter kobayashii]
MVGKEHVELAHRGVSLQLGLSHALVGCIVLAISAWLLSLGLPLSVIIGVAIVAGGALGWALTWNIQHGLFLLELALQRLAEGSPSNCRVAAGLTGHRDSSRRLCRR